MKKLLLSLLTIVAFIHNSSAQDSTSVKLQYKDGLGTYQQVIRVPGKTEPELYNMIERWFLSTYKNPDKAIKAKIPNESIRAQGFESDAVKIAGLVYSSLEYSLTVEIKQGKARFTLTNMNLVNDDGTNYYFENYVYKKDGSERTNSQASNIKESTDRISNNLFSSLRTALLNPDAKKDDW